MTASVSAPPVMMSGSPSASKSPSDNANGMPPTPDAPAIGYVRAGLNVPSPRPARTETSLETELLVTMSCNPSRSTSATSREKDPTLTPSRPADGPRIEKFLAVRSVPSPLPNRTDTKVDPALDTAMSMLPSRSRSPRATNDGLRPTT